MDWHVISCSIVYNDVPNKGIEQASLLGELLYTYQSFSINLYLTFSNVLLVLALNLLVHKSSYCKCSLAWCQARTFFYLQSEHIPSKWKNTCSNMQVLTKIKQSHYSSKSLSGLPGVEGIIAAYIWRNPSLSNSHPHRTCNFRTLSSSLDSNTGWSIQPFWNDSESEPLLRELTRTTQNVELTRTTQKILSHYGHVKESYG